MTASLILLMMSFFIKLNLMKRNLKLRTRKLEKTTEASILQDSTGSYSEGNNKASVNDTSLKMTNNGKHEQPTTWKENNRNPNTTNSKPSCNKDECLINSSYDERKTSDTVFKGRNHQWLRICLGEEER